MLSEPLLVVSRLAAVLDRLGVPYLVGGSLASSVFGVPRATQDVDLVADLRREHVASFVAALSDEFYVDAEMVEDAIRRRRSFNVIHLGTMFKADVFIMKMDPWFHEEMQRAREQTVGVGAESISIRFATPEDTLLHKLVWYRMGGEVSDRQWGDILGVLRIQADALDNEYLDTWAAHLQVADHLARARNEAGQ